MGYKGVSQILYRYGRPGFSSWVVRAVRWTTDVVLPIVGIEVRCAEMDGICTSQTQV